MNSGLRRLWADDRGAVISVELVLVLGILVFGLIPGLVALRNSINASLATLGNTALTVTPSFTYSGLAIVTQSGQTIAVVQGVEVDPSTGFAVAASQIPPIAVGPVAVPPAP